jgi:hypothetical protein
VSGTRQPEKTAVFYVDISGGALIQMKPLQIIRVNPKFS